ncbi:MAG TPA: hypothetical protein VEP90_02955, partial [Methylomirabilota bacterium]|nr:hypothetical protein [Methylomirabilota bacterium]
TMKSNTGAIGEMHILVRNRKIDQYFHDDKTFVEGRKGSNYTIQYRNKTGFRQKIVVSVDGLNVMTGDATWENGYCVEPYQTINIPGWRKDSGNVAAFKFSSIRGSYNQQNDSGQEQNIGVIGCKVYSEKYKAIYNSPYIVHHYHYEPPKPLFPIYFPSWPTVGTSGGGYYDSKTTVMNASLQGSVSNCMRSASPKASSYVASADAMAEPQSVGTGWGENKEFQTYTVNYDFNTYEDAVFVLYYDNIQGLRRRGVPLTHAPRTYSNPNPFPSGDGCPPPIKRY